MARLSAGVLTPADLLNNQFRSLHQRLHFGGHGGRRVFYPGLGSWNNADFQDEWKDVDESGRLRLREEPA